MNKYSKSDKFILSSSCKVVKGAKRSVLVDYQRTDVRIISNDYANLIEMLNRRVISSVKDKINVKSHEQFEKFLFFLISNEFGFISEDINSYPEISDEVFDNHINLFDSIIEVHPDRYNDSDFIKIIEKIDNLQCYSVQLRLLSRASLDLLKELSDIIKKTNISYLEIHVLGKIKNQKFYRSLIIDNPRLTELFIYGSENNKTVEVINKREGYYQISLGNINYRSSLLNDSICGAINFQNLNFGELKIYNMLKNHNGCLYKKLTIDSYGYIKNCPSIKSNFGHHSEIDLKKVIINKKFGFLGTIKKDEIEVCKDCEFRYSCTDCRAFTSDPDNIYSKPLKCGYDPYTNKWETWADNPLKTKAVKYTEL